ncbi:uncharacterized protein [Arachis hypogaea]|uniref:uncharacterized protein isoform X2 n=1 Tax=Arachis hypogaea TaxID=3818 RepID=UPI0010FC4306|nr:uncharacterized protein LOC112749751 isoform X2 [Arachis hypogaea]
MWSHRCAQPLSPLLEVGGQASAAGEHCCHRQGTLSSFWPLSELLPCQFGVAACPFYCYRLSFGNCMIKNKSCCDFVSLCFSCRRCCEPLLSLLILFGNQ